MKNLETLGGQNSRAILIVAMASSSAGPTPRPGLPYAFVYKNGVMTHIGTLWLYHLARLGDQRCRQGGARQHDGVGVSSTRSSWANGTFQDLGHHGTRFGEAVAINTKGIVRDFWMLPDAQGGERTPSRSSSPG